MMTWWHYLLLVNFYLILFFVFYKVLLRKETFFQLNRIYLVSATFLSFLIPLIQSEWVHQLFITQRVQQTIYATIDTEFIYRVKPVDSNPLTLGEILSFVYLAGAIALSARLVYQLAKLKMQIRTEAVQTPFSFFGTLRVDDSLTGRDTIVAHEEVHVEQWHSADVLLIEAIMIINWFNPVVYFYRKAIKHVHEFIADRKAVQAGTSKAEYAMLLLSQTLGVSPNQLTNTFFNQSLLKQRIMMLNQDESKRRALLKYGLSAPLFAAMLVFSSATVNNSALVRILNKKTDQALAITAVHLSRSAKGTDAVVVPIMEEKKTVVEKQRTATAPITLTLTATTSATTGKDSIAQTDAAPVFSAVEINPNFPGGDQGFNRFLSENIRYPEKAKAANVSGRVFIQFVVEKDGSLSGFKTLRDPGTGLGEEAMRVLEMSPKWSPGIQNGRAVRVQYTVPVNFSLVNDKPVTDTAKVKVVHIPGKRVYFFNTTFSDTVRRITYNPIPSGKTAISTKQSPFSGNTLIMLDGKEINKDDFDKLDIKSVANINVFKDDAAKVYGEKGKNGVISITTKAVSKQ